MDRIAQLVKKTRDKTFQETWKAPDGTVRRVNNTLGLASLGGATIDNEWNYIQAKLTRTLGMVFLENQARI
jgi:formate dehydrogenase major subunit